MRPFFFAPICAGAIRTRFDISLPDSRRLPMAGRGHNPPNLVIDLHFAPG
jgi:hypothetical protein